MESIEIYDECIFSVILAIFGQTALKFCAWVFEKKIFFVRLLAQKINKTLTEIHVRVGE